MRDYYDTLGINSTADEAEIKVAYRKAALKWHPDRNYGNVEQATQEFAECQAAYEILSDPNERAWYDRHKDSILRGDGQDGNDYDSEDISGLSADQLMPYFSKVSSSALDDSVNGFFTILRKLFDTIIAEEIASCEQQGIDAPNLPSLGGSQSDDYDVRRFYSAWSSFSSNKTFSWAEQYAYHRAPDRRVKRAMEKENAKSRQNKRKEYNEVIHKLTMYMRKRDFRYIARPAISEAQRKEELLEARKAQVEASRAQNRANQGEYAEQAWQKIDDKTLAEEEMQAYDEWDTEIECVACSKTFKSEKQYSTHEKSKKHIQTVKRLKWEMKKEAMELGLEYESDRSFETASQGSDLESPQDQLPATETPAEDTPQHPTNPQKGVPEAVSAATTQPSTKAPSLASDDEYAPRDEVEARLANNLDQLDLGDLSLEGSDTEGQSDLKQPVKSKKTKKQKAKARKLKNRG